MGLWASGPLVPLRLWASVPLGLCASVPLGLWASSPQDHWASRPLCHWAQLLGLLDSGALRTLGPLGGLWNSRSLGVLWDLPLPLCSAAHLPLCLFPRASFLPPPASCRLYSWPAGFGLFLSSLFLCSQSCFIPFSLCSLCSLFWAFGHLCL